MAPSLLALLLLVPVVDDQLEPITSTAISTFSDANQKTQVVPHLSLCGMSGFSCLSRATSVCMNLLNSVNFFLPPALLVFPVYTTGVVPSENRTEYALTCPYALFALVAFLLASAPVCLLVVTTITLS